MTDKVIGVVLDELRARKAQLSNAVAQGGIKTFEEYKFMCGEIRGLAAVEMYLVDLAKNLESFDE